MLNSAAGSGNRGICKSYFNAERHDFPSVPYSRFDFNDPICKTPSGDIENYSDPIQVDFSILMCSVMVYVLLLQVVVCYR